MGLDMYLGRINREAVGYINLDLPETKRSKPDLYFKVAPYINQRGDPAFYQWESLFEEVGYWRKANAIHHWFVENVQNGTDDCERYEVSKEKLEELLETAKEVLGSCVMVSGLVRNGQRFEGGKLADIMEPGKYVLDSSIAEELLPTTSGFFFGGTDYDEYYVKDIAYTAATIEKALNETDFDTHTIYYCSSW